MPTYIEVGFHDYEASCEDYFCNLVGPGVDQTVCPFPPPMPPSPALPPPVAPTEEDEDNTDVQVGSIAAILIAIALCAVIFMCVMIKKEKAGKPIFVDIDAPPPVATATKETIA